MNKGFMRVAIGSVTALFLQSLQPAAAIDCPDNLLAPEGLDPGNDNCKGSGCLISFKGYQWWTSYQYWPPPSYYYNANNQWAPQNVKVDSAGLHLLIQPQDMGGGLRPSAAELVAMYHDDGSKYPNHGPQANLGYGIYRVVAQVVTPAASWDQLDPNVTFGAFTYERVATSGKGAGGTNPNRELDLSEISRWGNRGSGSCTIDPRLCPGNSQFTLQPWDALPENLHRYTIAPNVNTVTLVMYWFGPGQPVTFRQYDGAYDLDHLPVNPSNQWKTSDTQDPYVPATACERIHLNLWMGNYAGAVGGYNPAPAAMPYEVVVTDFEYRPPSSH